MADFLLAEDDRVSAKLAILIITRKGFTVDHAENGEMAVEFCRSGLYRMVLMDVNMPVKDGIEASREIRLFRKAEEQPIVLMTAMTTDEVSALAGDIAITGIVEKPLNGDKLDGLVAAYL